MVAAERVAADHSSAGGHCFDVVDPRRESDFGAKDRLLWTTSGVVVAQ
jgi:hypothetical protein